MLVTAHEQRDDLNELVILERLAALLTGTDIRRTHEYRLRAGKTTPVWFALPRGRRSFNAVVKLGTICTAQRLTRLLRLKWLTPHQLQFFVNRTPLSEGHRAVIERAIRLEDERLAQQARFRREQEAGAAAHHGTGMTAELKLIAKGGPPPGRAVTRWRRGQPVQAPA